MLWAGELVLVRRRFNVSGDYGGVVVEWRIEVKRWKRARPSSGGELVNGGRGGERGDCGAGSGGGTVFGWGLEGAMM